MNSDLNTELVEESILYNLSTFIGVAMLKFCTQKSSILNRIHHSIGKGH